MSSKVGVVYFATDENKAASQVFRRLKEDCSEDDTERLSPFGPSNIFESVVAVAAVAAKNKSQQTTDR
jgi:hypothetical protein